ncbi:MAG TPA: glycosyltransferase family 2 protein [Anaerolineales bacterium]|nr:glycosyltransferase family 2 protein [Anaerolineales bacterium]
MRLSIIVVSWNTRELLEECLSSISNHLRSAEYEVIVVDNASTDGSVQMVKKLFPQVGLIENPVNLGFAVANNQALKIAAGRFLLLLNSDAMLISDSVSEALDFMNRHPAAGACGVRLINPDGTYQGSHADFPTLRSEFLNATSLGTRFVRPYYPSHPPGCEAELCEADWVTGAFILLRREVYEQVGGMDESFWMYSEETDWCYRVKQAGWKIYYLPRIEVLHIGGGSSANRRVEMVGQLYQSKVLFFAKHYGVFAAQRLRVMLCLIFLFRELLSNFLLLFPRYQTSQRWYSEMVTSQFVREACSRPISK